MVYIKKYWIKFTTKNKYAIAGGSNVYSTWRVSDEINMEKEINNIITYVIVFKGDRHA